MRESLLMTVARWVVRPLMYILFRPRISGRENLKQFREKRAAIVVANHINNLDPVIPGVVFPRNLHFLAKVEISRAPLIGALMRRFGLIFVNRDQKNDLRAARDYLRADMSLAIFPEGTCKPEFKKPNELLPFKFGAVRLAAETGAAVVPLAISECYKVFGRGRLRAKFGVPFYVKNAKDLTAANEKMRDEIAKLLCELGVKNVRKIPGRPAKNPAKSPPIRDKSKEEK